jgi:sugar transferase (PEP-CTERM/EpsH1 system associated)
MQHSVKGKSLADPRCIAGHGTGGYLRILLIADRVPYPLFSGDRLRTYNLLLRIAKQHEVWLVTFLDAPEETDGVQRIKEICHRVETVKLKHSRKLAYLPGLLKYGLTGKPVQLVFYYSGDLIRRIQKLVSLVDFDIIQIEHSHMALYLEALPSQLRSKSILTFHDVQFEKFNRIFHIERRLGKKVRAWLHSQMMRRWEPYYAERFGRCVAMSEVDRHLLLSANPRLRLSVITNGVDAHSRQPLPLNSAQNELVFVGSMDYAPCVDAALFFCHEVLPRIRSIVGEVELWIVGRNPVPEVRKLEGDGIHVTGQVDDVVSYYSRSTACVVPLRAGGGTRLKILEAMALGRPVISTSIGCEGLDVIDGKHLLVGDTPEQFAKQTVRLLTDHALHLHITTNARRLVVKHYDWDAIAEKLMRIYAELANEGNEPFKEIADRRIPSLRGSI